MNTIFKLSEENFHKLFTALKSKDYTLVAPVVHDGAIIYDKVESPDELPVGWTDQQSPSTYRLSRETRGKYFGFHTAPQSWKRFLYPPKRSLFQMKRNGKSLEFLKETTLRPKYAFIGVRPCELNAILIQDLIFNSEEYGDEDYKLRRKDLFIVAVNCTETTENCFCSSLKTGPRSKTGFDLALTEVVNKGEHYFVAEVGSDKGAAVMEQTNPSDATEQEISDASRLVKHAENKMKKSVETSDLPKILSNNLDHPHWDNIAKRCLTCGNCTMVCPTCFCFAVEDITDITGNKAERVRKWDSCYTMDFSKVAGGNFRITPKSRYRQWLTHKFSSWMEQFGVLGCVGCGRCITWCPVGIDLTAEINSIRGA
ncbi:MAG TPA: 4Fe-4S dicluster domain-containing protein [Candidatus Acidoferrales bacterium]|nr:4Fe-4S dicluster domain-containing protein [Candidatus Acidoferrales bacterium]